MPRRKARNTIAIATARNYVVSPLSSAPRAYPSRRDNESRDILERNVYHHPIYNKVMQDLPNKQEAITKVWTSSIQNSVQRPLGGSMCRPHRSIYPQRQRWLVNRLYGSHHDRPRF
jgi:hypothetical protein